MRAPGQFHQSPNAGWSAARDKLACRRSQVGAPALQKPRRVKSKTNLPAGQTCHCIEGTRQALMGGQGWRPRARSILNLPDLAWCSDRLSLGGQLYAHSANRWQRQVVGCREPPGWA